MRDSALNAAPTQTAQRIGIFAMRDSALLNLDAAPTQIAQILCHSVILNAFSFLRMMLSAKQQDNALRRIHRNVQSARFRVKTGRAQTLLREKVLQDLRFAVAQSQLFRRLVAQLALNLSKSLTSLPWRTVRYWRPLSTKLRMS